MEQCRFSRRNVIGAAVAAPLILSGCERRTSPVLRLRLGTSFPPTHPVHVCCQRAADAVRRRTGGRVVIDCYPSSQLGSDTDRIAQLRGGAIHLNACSGGLLSTFVPITAIPNIGFAFSTIEQGFAALDGGLGVLVRKAISDAGIVALPLALDNGFRQITNSTKPIHNPDDLEDMKLRVPPGRLWTSMFGMLGAQPATINFSETYSALQTRVVEGQENSLLIIESAKLFEVQTYCTMTNHMWDPVWILANTESMKQLPEAAQAILVQEFSRAALGQRLDGAAQVAAAARALEGRIAINRVDPQPFVAKLRARGFYAEWRDLLGRPAWSVLEQYAGKLT